MTIDKKDNARKKIDEKATVDAVMVSGALGYPNTERTNENDQKDVMKEKRIYVGPNILGLIAYTVIEGDYPSHVKEFIKKCDAIDKLFVPVNKLAETERNKVRKGTIEYRNYNKVQVFIKGEVEK